MWVTSPIRWVPIHLNVYFIFDILDLVTGCGRAATSSPLFLRRRPRTGGAAGLRCTPRNATVRRPLGELLLGENNYINIKEFNIPFVFYLQTEVGGYSQLQPCRLQAVQIIHLLFLLCPTSLPCAVQNLNRPQSAPQAYNAMCFLDLYPAASNELRAGLQPLSTRQLSSPQGAQTT